MIPIPALLVLTCLAWLTVDDLGRLVNRARGLYSHSSQGVVRLFSRLGHRPPDPRDYR